MKIAATLAVAALALPALADAKTIRHSGSVTGDPETEISYRVKTKNGKPRKVAGFEARGIVTKCDGEPTRFNFTVFVPISVNKRGNYGVRLPGDDGAILRLSGSVTKNGKAGTGNIKSNDFNEGGMSCKVPKQHFKTTS